jgi:hypothetical protein
MEPLNDNELNDLLRQWKAPGAPSSLVGKFFPKPELLPWWRWLFAGSIRVPVPMGLAAMVILALSVFFGVSDRQRAVRPAGAVTLADFQPVKQLQPRIIRSTSYEDN